MGAAKQGPRARVWLAIFMFMFVLDKTEGLCHVFTAIGTYVLFGGKRVHIGDGRSCAVMIKGQDTLSQGQGGVSFGNNWCPHLSSHFLSRAKE